MNVGLDHIVVMAMENRSFDHLLGYFTNIIPGLNGLLGTETNPSGPGRPPAAVSAATIPIAYTRSPDPGHEPANVVRQLFGDTAQGFDPKATPTNSGFVLDYARAADEQGPIGAARAESIMECFTSAELPGVTALATEGVVCDNWFSSVPGPTWPNRFYIHCATSGGLNRSPTNGEIIAAIEGNHPYDLPSIYEALDKAKASWRIYYDTPAQTMAIKYVGNRYDDHRERFGDMFDFRDDCASGDLPNYSFIEPKQWSLIPSATFNDMHPPHDVRLGDSLIASVYNTLKQSKNWDRTLFVLMFDEHGGFFDHVSPPGALDPATPKATKQLVVNPDGKLGEDGFGFNRFGVRVPCILASPALTTAGPDHTVYDHSSLIASIRKLLGITKPLGNRDAVANDFWHLFAKRSIGTSPAPATVTTARAMVAARTPAPVIRPDAANPQASYAESLATLALHFHTVHARSQPKITRPRAPSALEPTKPSRKDAVKKGRFLR